MTAQARRAPAKAATARVSTRTTVQRVVDEPTAVSSAPEVVEITPAVGFAWIVNGIRPYLGYVFVVLGLVALFLGWYGASGTPIVAKQVPYLASDGILAVVLIAIGNRIFLIDDLRRDSGRLDRLEEMVKELHVVLLSRSDAVPDSARANGSRPAGKPFRAVARGTSYHVPDCAMVTSKDSIEVSKGDVISRGLRPCRVCEPPVVKK